MKIVVKRNPTLPIALSKRRLCAGAVLAASVLTFPLLANAMHELPDCGTPSNAPDDISLRLSLKNGQVVFREGEIIALTAKYQALKKKKYTLDNRSYDRSGRLDGMEVFCLDPESGSDPLSDYYSQPVAFFGGGLFSDADPGEKPFDVQIELNEWQSLPPGSYRLSIVGNRVTIHNNEDSMGFGGAPVTLRSNTVAFRVIAAEPEWQAAQLASAVTVLDSPTSKEEDKKHAARVLRFLGSEDATLELVKRYVSGDKPFGWEFKFGLFGSPDRAIAIHAMHDAIKNPDHPITREFAQTLATLELQSDPGLSAAFRVDADQHSWKQVSEVFWKEEEKRVAEYMAEAAANGHPTPKQ